MSYVTADSYCTLIQRGRQYSNISQWDRQVRGGIGCEISSGIFKALQRTWNWIYIASIRVRATYCSIQGGSQLGSQQCCRISILYYQRQFTKTIHFTHKAFKQASSNTAWFGLIHSPQWHRYKPYFASQPTICLVRASKSAPLSIQPYLCQGINHTQALIQAI